MKLNHGLILLILFPLCISSSLPAAIDQDSAITFDFKPAPKPLTPCDVFFQYLYNLTTNTTTHDIPQNLTQDATYFLQYSGHSINDLGFYSQCKSTPARNYFLMEVNSSTMNNPDGTFGLYVGLCLPDYCTQAYLTSKSANVIQYLHLLKIKNLNTVDIAYIDPSDYKIHRGFWLYFTIILFTAILLINVLGTCLPRPGHSESKLSHNGLRRSITNQVTLNNSSSFKDYGSNNIADSLLSSDDQPQPKSKFSLHDKICAFLTARPKLLKFLDCFDFNKNVTHLFQKEKDARMDQILNLLDGLRSIAFIGIIYAHTFLNSSMSKNELALVDFARSPGLLLALAAFFGVDVFFLLSGFLQGFQLTGKLKKMPFHPKTYFKLIRHRWIRLVPAYFVAILLFWKVGVFLGDGPLWYQYVNRAQQCDSWWKNILFLDNVLNTTAKDYCFNWGWYLACDFQMFLIAPLICWIYLKNKSRAHNILWIMGLFTFIAGFMGAVNSNFKYSIPPAASTGNFWSEFYSNSLVRLSSYIIGIFIGTQYRAYKQGESDNLFAAMKNSQKLAYTLSLVGLFTTIFVVYYPRTVQTGSVWPDGFNFLWQVMDRPLLALGLFMTVLPGIVGFLRPVRWFLGSYLFSLCSKLSYCGYLVQLIVIWVCYKSESVYLGFSDHDKSNLTIAFIMVSLAIGTVLYLLVEKPAVNLEAAFVGQSHGQNQNKKKDLTTEKPSIQEYKITGRKKLDETN